MNYLDYSIESIEQDSFLSIAKKVQIIIMELDSFPLKRSVNISHGRFLLHLVKKLRSPGNSRFPRLILFGHDIDMFPGDYPEADCILANEPEANIAGAVDSLLTGTVPPSPLTLEDLDKLPFPDRSPISSYAEHGGAIDSLPTLEKSTLIRTSSGCSNRCIFCQRKAWFRKFRKHSIPYVLSEFDELRQQNYKNIWVTDDNFTFDLKWAKAVLRGLIEKRLTRGMKIALSSWTRIDEEFLQLARDAHVSIISFGVESANKDILEFYRKTIQLDEFRQLIRFADSIGLYTVGNFIIGAPMETEETMAETFEYIKETPFDRVNIKTLDYMAGSSLYEMLPPGIKNTRQRHVFACKENGLNNFPLGELKNKAKYFKDIFRESRSKRLKEKTKRFGPPYFLRGKEPPKSYNK